MEYPKPKYRVGDIIKIDYALENDQNPEHFLFYCLITKIEEGNYYYLYIGDGETGWDSIINIDDDHRIQKIG